MTSKQDSVFEVDP
jgi:hypothetical protein